MLPRADEAYRRQITLGIDGDPRAALKARSFLANCSAGKSGWFRSSMVGLMAHWNLHPGALLKSLGTYGSGGGLVALFATVTAMICGGRRSAMTI